MKAPLTLAIETSNPSATVTAGGPRPGVALVGGGETLGVEAVEFRAQHDDLVTAIERLFVRVGRRPADLTAVAVSAGPGGYTAVRLAITVAKMICEATGAACMAVPTAAAVARRVGHGGVFGVALASKGETTFLTRFDVGGAALDQGRLVGAEELEGAEVSVLVVDQFVPEAIRRRATELKIAIEPPVFDPVAVAEVAGGLAPVDPVALLPIYPREPEAVTKWRKLHRGAGPDRTA